MINDLAYYVAIIFVVAFGLVGAYIFTDVLGDSIQEIPQLSNETKVMYSGVYGRFPTVFDSAFLMVAIAGMLGICFLVYFLDINPFAFFGILIIMVILSAVAGYMANAWLQFGEDSAISASMSQLPITNFFMSNYMIIIIIFCFIVTTIFFAKPQGGGM